MDRIPTSSPADDPPAAEAEARRLRRQAVDRVRQRLVRCEWWRTLTGMAFIGAGGVIIARLATESDPIPRAAVLLGVAAVAVTISKVRVKLVTPSQAHFERLWQRLSERAGEEAGLVAALCSALDRPTEIHPPFRAAILERGRALRPPTPEDLAVAFPAISKLALISAISCFIAASLLPDFASESNSPEASNPTGSTSTLLHRDFVPAETLRAQIRQREEWAKLLDGSVALAPLANVLREGGQLLPLDSLSAEDRRRLDRLIALGELRGAAAEELALLAQIRDGAEVSPEKEWSAPGAIPPDAPGEFARGGSGEASFSSVELADGGQDGESDRSASIEDRDRVDPAGNPRVEPLRTEGRAIAEGSRPNAGGPVASSARTSLDAARAWASRLELEPRWIPVIEAYRREENRR